MGSMSAFSWAERTARDRPGPLYEAAAADLTPAQAFLLKLGRAKWYAIHGQEEDTAEIGVFVGLEWKKPDGSDAISPVAFFTNDEAAEVIGEDEA